MITMTSELLPSRGGSKLEAFLVGECSIDLPLLRAGVLHEQQHVLSNDDDDE